MFETLPKVAGDGNPTGNWVRKIKSNRTLNDHVEDLHKFLIDTGDEDYIALLQAVTDEEAVHGSLAIDNAFASQRIKERALETNNMVKDKKLATISKALNIVMKRYGLSRKERRYTVGGELVASDNGE